MARVDVKVNTGAEKFEIQTGNIPVIHVTEEPENGRANVQLVNRLHDVLGKKPGIVSGYSSSRKKLSVDMEEEDFREKLAEYNA